MQIYSAYQYPWHMHMHRVTRTHQRTVLNSSRSRDVQKGIPLPEAKKGVGLVVSKVQRIQVQ